MHDYTRKGGVIYKNILLPENAPQEFYDRATLWNVVEKVEKNSNAQLAREIRVALPQEFDDVQNYLLTLEYVRQNFVDRGMCADFAIHNKGDGNPHAHILLTMRPLEKDGSFGAKSRIEYILDGKGERQKLPSGRYKTRKITTTDWDSRENAEIWRKNWADIQNKYLSEHDIIQVDHRSYERQELDLIPTIHLGVVANDLEKKGVATERGDINRAIKKKNARLREINGEIRTIKQEQDKILNPPTPQFIIDIKNSIKAQNSVGYENWAILFNLQQMAKTLIYIQEHGYTDLQSLQTGYTNAVNDYNDIIAQRTEIRDKIKELKALRNVATTYRKTAETYGKYNDPRATGYFKNQYYENHKSDIEAHKKARAYIFGELGLTKFPSLKNLSEEIKELAEKEKTLTATLSTAKDKFKKLDVVNYNASMLLGYKDLEERNIDVVRNLINNYGFERYANVPIHKGTFAEAKNYSDRAIYFQNRYLNRDCAKYMQLSANKQINKNCTQSEVLDYSIEIYGLERVEYVLAATVLNDKDNKLSDFKEWAEQKDLPNEPDDTTALDDGVNTEVWLSSLIRAVQLKSAVKLWDNGQSHKLSLADRMAVAQLKADERNRINQEQQAQDCSEDYDNEEEYYNEDEYSPTEEHDNKKDVVRNPFYQDGHYADFSHLNPEPPAPYSQPQQKSISSQAQQPIPPSKPMTTIEMPSPNPAKKKIRGIAR